MTRTIGEYEGDQVTLMTLHAAKGLEFRSVFVIAMEQGILPHQRSIDNPNQMEEERRLLFVGMTRAERILQLSHARRRAYRGSERGNRSQFLLIRVAAGRNARQLANQPQSPGKEIRRVR